MTYSTAQWKRSNLLGYLVGNLVATNCMQCFLYGPNWLQLSSQLNSPSVFIGLYSNCTDLNQILEWMGKQYKVSGWNTTTHSISCLSSPIFWGGGGALTYIATTGMCRFDDPVSKTQFPLNCILRNFWKHLTPSKLQWFSTIYTIFERCTKLFYIILPLVDTRWHHTTWYPGVQWYPGVLHDASY